MRKFFLVVVSILASLGVYAQEYTIRSYPIDVMSYIGSLYIDGKDVWVGSSQGAFLFNGDYFVPYNRSNGMPGDTVKQITKDVNGNFWFLTENGIAVKKSNGWENLGATNFIKRIDNDVWFSKNGGLGKARSPQEITYINPVMEYPIKHFLDIYPRGNDTYYLFGDYRVYKLESGTAQEEMLLAADRSPGYTDHENTFYTTARTYLDWNIEYRKLNDETEYNLSIPDWSSTYVNGIAGDDKGQLYFTSGKGLAIYNKNTNTWQYFKSGVELPKGSIFDVQVDSNYNVWLIIQQWTMTSHKMILTSLLTEESVGHYIEGRIFHDVNEDGVQSSDEPGLANQFIKILPSQLNGITDANGNFSIKAVEGKNSITWQQKAFWHSAATPVSFTVNVPEEQNNFIRIGLGADIIKDLSVSISGSAVRPGFTTEYWLTAVNKGTVETIPTVTLQHDAMLTYIESNLPPNTTSGSNIDWNIGLLKPQESKQVRVMFRIPTNAERGKFIKAYARTTIISGETAVSDNVDSVRQEITGSFDPNDKLVTEGIRAERYVLKNTKLNYTIRFQNTGTDTAFVVRISDVIDSKFDITSLEVAGASHPMTYSLEDRTLTFTFNNIELPDSTRNEPGSHGFVKYRIAPVASMANGSVVRNKADIYFDYNEPVVTNELLNTYVDVLPVDEITGIHKIVSRVKIYPNPARGFLTFEAGDYAGSIGSVSLISVTGRQTQEYTIQHDLERLDVRAIPAGLYLLKFTMQGKSVVQKIVIQEEH
jgi:hypothetical protein